MMGNGGGEFLFSNRQQMENRKKMKEQAPTTTALVLISKREGIYQHEEKIRYRKEKRRSALENRGGVETWLIGKTMRRLRFFKKKTVTYRKIVGMGEWLG